MDRVVPATSLAEKLDAVSAKLAAQRIASGRLEGLTVKEAIALGPDGAEGLADLRGRAGFAPLMKKFGKLASLIHQLNKECESIPAPPGDQPPPPPPDEQPATSRSSTLARTWLQPAPRAGPPTTEITFYKEPPATTPGRTPAATWPTWATCPRRLRPVHGIGALVAVCAPRVVVRLCVFIAQTVAATVLHSAAAATDQLIRDVATSPVHLLNPPGTNDTYVAHVMSTVVLMSISARRLLR